MKLSLLAVPVALVAFVTASSGSVLAQVAPGQFPEFPFPRENEAPAPEDENRTEIEKA